jgi:hypothetical protein
MFTNVLSTSWLTEQSGKIVIWTSFVAVKTPLVVVIDAVRTNFYNVPIWLGSVKLKVYDSVAALKLVGLST